MHILVIGAAGMVGRKLVAAVVKTGEVGGKPVERLTLVDVVAPSAPTGFSGAVETLAVDLSAPGVAATVVAKRPDLIFHLAAIVSGEAEADFDKGYRINLDGTRFLLEAIRQEGLKAPYHPRLVFTSSIAVFGAPFPEAIGDEFFSTPLTSYGTQKAIGELLLADYTRKGFLDGVGIRLPTICVRPGKPNKAASSFASGIIREPLAGVEAACPVDASTRMWLVSPRTVVDSLIAGYEAPASALPPSHAVNVPGISVTVGEMVDALRRVAGDAVAGRVVFRHDETIDRIVRTWPRDFDAKVGRALGMRTDASFEAIVRQYVEHDMPKRA